jgi:hypothetical protein
VSRFFYNAVVVVWLLQCVACKLVNMAVFVTHRRYGVFCVYWGRQVTSVISSAQNMGLLTSNCELCLFSMHVALVCNSVCFKRSSSNMPNIACIGCTSYAANIIAVTVCIF